MLVKSWENISIEFTVYRNVFLIIVCLLTLTFVVLILVYFSI